MNTSCKKITAHSISKKEYNKVKWPVRVGVVAFFGHVSGGIVMTGFENGFYDNK